VVDPAFAVFAAPGVAVKESAEMAIAAAIMEIVFMFGLPRIGFAAAEHARRIREYNLIKLNSGTAFQLSREAGRGSRAAPVDRNESLRLCR
jgi:hypothetical protein